MVASTGLWHRLPNNPDLDCPSLQPLRVVSGPSQRVGSCFMYRSNLSMCLVVPSWLRSHTWILGLKVIRVAGSQLGVHLSVLHILRRSVGMGDSGPDVYSQYLYHHHFHLLSRLVHFQKILDQWRSLT